MLLTAAEYNEQYRPAYHFSPRVNWTNDPCGLVFAFGKYQLFFQYNPFANVWGHMSWGHAASPDLVHWKQLPVAIAEDNRAAIFTGSSVFDTNNTSGLCKSARRCIVSIYTGQVAKTAISPDKETQNLASSDDGLTWTKYSGNPVLDLGRRDTRDPKVFWYEPEKQWVMVIVLADEKKVRLFRSRNLRSWTTISDFGPMGATGGAWECPDLYPLPVEKTAERRWILKVGINPGHIAGGSGEQYFIGQFDGTAFKTDDPNPPVHWLDYGRDSYCALTFNNEPDTSGRHIIGWMNNWQYAAHVPTSPWRGSMTLPRTLTLGPFAGALHLFQQPVSELQSLREEPFRFEGSDLGELNRKMAAWPGRSQTFELQASIDMGAAKQVAWDLLKGDNDETVLRFDGAAGQLSLDRTKGANANFDPAFPSRTTAPLTVRNGALELHVFVDRSSVEVFAQHGAIAMTNLVFPKPESTALSLTASGGQVRNAQIVIWPLRTAWTASKPAAQ